MDHFQPSSVDIRKQELLEARFLGARVILLLNYFSISKYFNSLTNFTNSKNYLFELQPKSPDQLDIFLFELNCYVVLRSNNLWFVGVVR
jgi:hypothetical protein